MINRKKILSLISLSLWISVRTGLRVSPTLSTISRNCFAFALLKFERMILVWEDARLGECFRLLLLAGGDHTPRFRSNRAAEWFRTRNSVKLKLGLTIFRLKSLKASIFCNIQSVPGTSSGILSEFSFFPP